MLENPQEYLALTFNFPKEQQGSMHKINSHRYQWESLIYQTIPISQALAPYQKAGCCAVVELVSRALFIGVCIVS